MKRNFTILGLALAMCFGLQAQQCATVLPWEEPEVVKTHTEAELEAMEAEYYKQTKAYQALGKLQQGKKAKKLRIPMVVHVIHNYGPENVTDEAINQLVDVLNSDFNAVYPNKHLVYDEFQDILGNTEVEFRLAKIGPNGECVSGINRIPVEDSYFSNYSNGQGQIESIKRQVNWNTEKYMNVYVVGSIASAGGGGIVAGYATFPRNQPFETDGFVTIYRGLTDIAGTSSHEIGHYLALPHTFGCGAGDPASCGCDDGIEDTPNTIGYPSTCPSKANSVSCGTLDNIHNIMDYSSCAVNFTLGQSAVMRGALLNQRSVLVSDENLAEVGADYDLADAPKFLCTADFAAPTDLPYCPGSEITFQEITTHNAIEFNWSFEGGTPATSTERDPKVLYNTPGIFNVTLTVTDGDTTITVSKDEFIKIQDNNFLGDEYGEGFESIDFDNTQSLEIINEDGDRTFEISPEAGFNSSTSTYIRNRFVPSGRTDELVTNTMNISGVADAVLSFDFAFAKRTENNDDNLEVYVSQDCGVSWTRRKLFRADASTGSSSSLVTAPTQSSGDFIPTNDQWTNYTVNINSFKSDGFKARLVWNSGGGNNIYIDNLFIGSATAVGVSENVLNNAVKLYPNPNNGNLSLVSELGNIASLEIVNVYGAVVYKAEVGSSKADIQMNDAKPGIYFARVTSETGVTSNIKFVVQ